MNDPDPKDFGYPEDEGDFSAMWEEEDGPPTADDIAEEDREMLRRQANFRRAAQFVAAAYGEVPGVERVTLFGSVAAPLCREVPRFRRYKRRGIEILHECRDVDIAVHLADLQQLPRLRKLRSRALNELLASHDIGVPHHQVDIAILEPGTDRFLGGLCLFARCPADKPPCDVPGCGAPRFLQQFDDYLFDKNALRQPGVEVLWPPPSESHGAR